MTEHYHGTPITPRRVLRQLAGCCFCVSFHRDENLPHVHELGRAVMLDNGAFSAWTRRICLDWSDYYRWCERWLRDFPTTWAVIPDVIGGDDAANDGLVALWPFGERGAPVWHMHESLGRLVRLCARWPRVCIGSSGAYAEVGSLRWHDRMSAAMNELCGDGSPPCRLHMMRGMQMAGSHYPFDSVDSADLARNHHRPYNDIVDMAHRWASRHCATTWLRRPIQRELPL